MRFLFCCFSVGCWLFFSPKIVIIYITIKLASGLNALFMLSTLYTWIFAAIWCHYSHFVVEETEDERVELTGQSHILISSRTKTRLCMFRAIYNTAISRSCCSFVPFRQSWHPAGTPYPCGTWITIIFPGETASWLVFCSPRGDRLGTLAWALRTDSTAVQRDLCSLWKHIVQFYSD